MTEFTSGSTPRFTEVADRVWVARLPEYDVNVGLVAGAAGLLVVDTYLAGYPLLDLVGRVSPLPVLHAVNTHVHVDHVQGNPLFASVVAHENCRAEGVTQTFSSVLPIDLGDRLVELVHPGRGHTDGDLVVRVPDADVLLAGDLVEESGPPQAGEDAFPQEWPLTLDVVLQLVGPQTVVVPGHGAAVDREFVERQRDELATRAEELAAQDQPRRLPLI